MSLLMNTMMSLSQTVLGQVAPEFAPPAPAAMPAPAMTAADAAAPMSMAAPSAADTAAPSAPTAQPLVDNAASPMAPASMEAAAPALPDAGAAALPSVGDPLVAPDAAQGALDVAAAAASAAPAPAEVVDTSMGFIHFIAQGDFVGKTLFAILIVMSLVSWYLILVKTLSNTWRKRRSMSFLNRFWKSSSLEQVEKETINQHGSDPYSHLTLHAIEARRYHAQYGATNLEAAGSNSEFVTRAMRKVIDEETAKMENGLTVLASVGSTAPFVGLFGTVWGVYHALVGIGLSDGVTINHIAGPVGEALIMTGLGLAVAIPAVLAYNALVRSNRVQLSQLDAFAHDLFAFLGTGQPVPVSEGRTRAMRRLGEPTAVKRSA